MHVCQLQLQDLAVNFKVWSAVLNPRCSDVILCLDRTMRRMCFMKFATQKSSPLSSKLKVMTSGNSLPISINIPNINCKFQDILEHKLETADGPKLFHLGSSHLHTVHGTRLLTSSFVSSKQFPCSFQAYCQKKKYLVNKIIRYMKIWFSRRKERGIYHLLMKEFLRMTKQQFCFLVEKVLPLYVLPSYGTVFPVILSVAPVLVPLSHL